jgi:hypothetical protein
MSSSSGFRLRRLSSTTSGGSSADTEDCGARCWLREWRSIQTQNPKKTPVIASTAIVGGSIVFSSYLGSLLSDFLLRDSSWVLSRGFPPLGLSRSSTSRPVRLTRSTKLAISFELTFEGASDSLRREINSDVPVSVDCFLAQHAPGWKKFRTNAARRVRGAPESRDVLDVNAYDVPPSTQTKNGVAGQCTI